MSTMQLSPEALERAWRGWCERATAGLARPYRSYPRTIATSQAFEDWLWTQGGQVREQGGQRTLLFNSEEMGMLFAMRWC